jgi:dihydrodipicolinate synthase/N-acetylneuraminate lyase
MRYHQALLVSCEIPWTEQEEFMEDLFRQEVRQTLGIGFNNLYVFGTAGEGYAVSDRQFDEITRVFHEETRAPDVRPMVGVISLSLTTIIERIERAAGLGFTAFQISLPSWGTLSDRELHTFFREVCGRFSELRFLHYNLPRAGRVLTAEEYVPLAAEHPNLVATKYGAGELRTVVGLLTLVPQVRHFFTEFGFGAGSLIGPCGLLASSSTANLARMRRYYAAGVAQDVPALRRMMGELREVGAVLHQAVGAAAHMDGAYDKFFSKLHQPDFPLRLLPPYESASDAAFEQFRAQLAAAYPQWLPGGTA